LRGQRKFAESEGLYKKVLELRSKSLHAGDPLLSVSLLNLVAILNAEQKYAEARKVYADNHQRTPGIKIVKCQMCESAEHLVPVYFGPITPDIKVLAEKGKIRIGGKARGKMSPQFFCTACDALLDSS